MNKQLGIGHNGNPPTVSYRVVSCQVSTYKTYGLFVWFDDLFHWIDLFHSSSDSVQAMDAGQYNFAIAFQERIKISDEKMKFYEVDLIWCVQN